MARPTTNMKISLERKITARVIPNEKLILSRGNTNEANYLQVMYFRTKSTKRVRFAIDEEEEEIEDEMDEVEGEGEDEQMDEEEEGEGDMLMGAVQDKDEETQTKLDRSQQKVGEVYTL